MKVKYLAALDAMTYCIYNDTDVTIYATVSDEALKTGLGSDLIKNKIRDTHLFEIILSKNNQFNSINGRATCFIDNHTDPIYEFVYDLSVAYKNENTLEELTATINDVILNTLKYLNERFSSFLSNMTGIKSPDTGIEDLIEIKTDMVKDDNEIPNTVKLTNYEHYRYRMSDFDDNRTTEYINGINTNPSAKDSKVNKLLQKCFDILLRDELDDVIMAIELETTTSVGNEFIAHIVFETNYILGEKVLCLLASYDKYEIIEPAVVWYGKNNKPVEEEIATTLYSTLKHIYKITSNPVDANISYYVEKNEGLYV